MSWIVSRIAASFFYATTVHLDDYLIDKYHRYFSVLTLAVVSGLFGLLPATIFFFIRGPGIFSELPSHHLSLILCSGVIAFISLFLYLQSLDFGEATTSVIFFRLTPVLALIGGRLFLGERISPTQTIGVFVTVAATILFSFNFSKAKVRLKTKQILFMLGAVACELATLIIYKFIVIDYGFITTSFWVFTTIFLCALLFLLFSRSVRRKIRIAFFTKNRYQKKFIFINLSNEILYFSGEVSAHYANSIVPIALSTALGGTLQVFTFLIGLIMHFINPRILGGNYDRRTLIQKITGVIMILVGGFLIVA